jgi:integrase/recombinase XerD
MVHDIRAAQKRRDREQRVRLWDWSRPIAWRRVSEVMEAAGVAGGNATPKGLRHGIGIKMVMSGVPLNALQKWLGHAQLTTTSIYAHATGPEAQQFAERTWQ